MTVGFICYVEPAQLDNMSSMSSSMSNQSPLTLTVPAEPTENDFIDNYDLDGNDNDYSSFSDKIVHVLGGYIAPEHWLACKAVLVFHAGSKTSKLASMNKTAKEMACLLAYKQAIAALDSTHFSVESRKYFACSKTKKDEPMTSEALYQYYLDSRSNIRCAVIPLLPVNFLSMKSGKGFHDTCNDMLLQEFRKELALNSKLSLTPQEIENKLPPQFWEYKKSPWYLTLTVKKFRKDPQLTNNVVEVLGDASNIPLSSRAARKGEDQKHRQQKYEYDCVDRKSRTLSKQSIWAKLHAAKALEETANVLRRQGQLDELEKTLNLLDRMKSTIIDSEYTSRVQAVFKAMPNPQTYKADFQVIIVIDGYQENRSQIIEVWDPKDADDED